MDTDSVPSTSLRPRVNSRSSIPQQHLTTERMDQHHTGTSNAIDDLGSKLSNISMTENATADNDDNDGLPTESQLVLLCLDYLRDLRRAYPAEELQEIEGLNADYLSVAIFALGKCFTKPETLAGNNDCMMDPMKQPPLSPRHMSKHHDYNSNKSMNPMIPSLEEINHEILYLENPHMADEDNDGDQKKDDFDTSDPYHWYDYDDQHPSNVHRFYPLSGLASGPTLRGPLTLGEITAAGLAGLGARSRQDAEKDMIESSLFEQFVQAVKSKGFFIDPDNDTPLSDPEEERQRIIRQQRNYDDRFRKVVAKFRTKLAVKAEASPPTTGGASMTAGTPSKSIHWFALNSADRQRRRRGEALEQARWKKNSRTQVTTPDRRTIDVNTYAPNKHTEAGVDCFTPRSPAHHPVDIEGAKRAKAEGNVFMQKKQYEEAVQAYTRALKISPNGPESHVYFSNRAAALLSMKNFGDAILDSERSLALKPDYGKAHARLGLAHFLSGNYRQSVEAYTVSLKYDPDNASSKVYLEKAAKRLAETKQEKGGGGIIQSSFSLVSEWETSQRQNNHQFSPKRSPSPHHGRRSRRSPSPLPRHVPRHPPSPKPVSTINTSHENPDAKQHQADKWKAKGNAVSVKSDQSMYSF